MLYTNFLRTAFIKVDDRGHIIPIIERELDFDTYWTNIRYYTNDKIIGTVNEIYTKLDWLNEDLKSKYGNEYDVDAFWFFSKIKINNKKITFRQFKSYFRKAIKNALTIEEYKALGVRFCVTTYDSADFDSKRIGIEPLGLKIITSTEKLKEIVSLYSEHYAETNIKAYHLKPYYSDMNNIFNK